MTPWVLRIIVVTLLVFPFTQGGPLQQALWLYPPAVLTQPWGLVTYMFLHADMNHILFNMIGLFFFGPRLEMRLGGKDFLKLYLLSGLGGALFSFIFSFNTPVIGASGAVLGILIAFAYYWPRDEVLLMFVLPVQVWVLAVGYTFMTVWGGFSGIQSTTAHFAHLGGIVVGFLYVRYRERSRRTRKVEKPNSHYKAPGVNEIETRERWRNIPLDHLHELNRTEVKQLLEKIDALGSKALTPDERAFLDRMIPWEPT